ncbi:Integrase [Actinidia chinensis var. chinensis]|uniref:Integrase n=1 Tax=Actinidia chinensis var. chinensis TaxID=1590841 RepID=A0A2R6QPA7_ACTCC|nr:Integrase [Actinidia chinensis var. chinensis]
MTDWYQSFRTKPLRRVSRCGTTARGGRNARRGRNEWANDEGSQHEGNSGNQNDRREQNMEQPGLQPPPNNLLTDFVAALMAHMAQVPRANTSNRAMEVVREFRKLNPPMFDGVSSDPLVADHWLLEIRKLFNVLDVTEDAVRVKLVACQLSGEANEWWKFIRGLDDSIQKFVMSGGHTNFAAVLELERNLEASGVNKKNARAPTTTVSVPTSSFGGVSRNYGNQNRKRQGETLQFLRNRSTFWAPTSSGFGGNSSRPPMTCHQCGQPGHIRTQCPNPKTLPPPREKNTLIKQPSYALF